MPRLILIPGLGASRLLFEPQRHHFDQDLFLPDWFPPMFTNIAGKRPVPETIRDYAHRWAERWKDTVLSNPQTRAQYWLGGVSLGGIIALEAAIYLTQEGLPPKGLFLIASARSSDALPRRMRPALLLARILGAKIISKWAATFAKRVAAREGLSELDARLLTRMAESINYDVLLWAAAALPTWTFPDSDWKSLTAAGVRIHQIHGDRDWAFPPKQAHPDQVIRGGRHLINMTHAEEVNVYLESKMNADRPA